MKFVCVAQGIRCYKCGQYNEGVGSITPCINFTVQMGLKDCPPTSEWCIGVINYTDGKEIHEIISMMKKYVSEGSTVRDCVETCVEKDSMKNSREKHKAKLPTFRDVSTSLFLVRFDTIDMSWDYVKLRNAVHVCMYILRGSSSSNTSNSNSSSNISSSSSSSSSNSNSSSSNKAWSTRTYCCQQDGCNSGPSLTSSSNGCKEAVLHGSRIVGCGQFWKRDHLPSFDERNNNNNNNNNISGSNNNDNDNNNNNNNNNNSSSSSSSSSNNNKQKNRYGLRL
uniref:Uncharacterized protein n=1 Tax=Vespula pensylvanica TaxID=30213 RepID=A0A834NZC4_VESPE|nr:hypothetical protein H0235_009766 [Vespula pensylvanica]